MDTVSFKQIDYTSSECQGLLNRLTAAVGAIEEMLDQYALYMGAGSYGAARETSLVLVRLLLIAYTTATEIETASEQGDLVMTEVDESKLDGLNSRLSSTRARLVSLQSASV